MTKIIVKDQEEKLTLKQMVQEAMEKVDRPRELRARVKENRPMKEALLVMTARALDLLNRVPAYFAARGWEQDDRMQTAMAAICMVRLGQPEQKWRIPPGTDDGVEWKTLVGVSSSERIVEVLGLESFLKPIVLVSR